MKIKQNIFSHNSKGQNHGYQERYADNKLYFRGSLKNGKIHGYVERTWGKQTLFYIR